MFGFLPTGKRKRERALCFCEMLGKEGNGTHRFLKKCFLKLNFSFVNKFPLLSWPSRTIIRYSFKLVSNHHASKNVVELDLLVPPVVQESSEFFYFRNRKLFKN